MDAATLHLSSQPACGLKYYRHPSWKHKCFELLLQDYLPLEASFKKNIWEDTSDFKHKRCIADAYCCINIFKIF